VTFEPLLRLFRRPDYGAIAAGVPRSSKWPAARDKWLREHPACVVCGRPAEAVHHSIPFHVRPDLELDESNFESVCDADHFRVGHLGDWQWWNAKFREAAMLCRMGMMKGP
jgi:5-methylcytosine-specific restriction endonuclease McrA